MRLDDLWQFMQVDMEADRFESKMRQSENRQKLLKQRNFLMEQQANMKKIEADIAAMQDRLEAVNDEARTFIGKAYKDFTADDWRGVAKEFERRK
mgnify:CR=1 FL=1